MTKVDKAFRELVKLGLVDESPTSIFGAQATGCSPVSKAFAAGHDVVQPVRPDTIAKSLAIGNPADGPYAIDVARRTGGAIADVSDAEVVEGIQLLAQTEGIFAETAGGVTVATLRKLLAAGPLDPELRPSCSTPATGSRRWTPSHRWRPRPYHQPEVRGVPCLRRTEGPGVSATVRIPTILRPYTGGAVRGCR